MFLTNGANATTTGSAGGTVVLAQTNTLTFTNLREGVEIRIHRTSDGALLGGVEDHTDPAVVFDRVENGVRYYKYAFSYDSILLGGVAVYIQVLSLNFENQKLEYTLGSSDSTLPLFIRGDRVYSDPP